MRLSNKGIALFLAAILMSGCSRVGFKDSINRASSSQGSSMPAQNTSDSQSDEALVFDMDVGELDEDNVYLYYALPRAVDPSAEDAAEHISEKIHAALFSLRDEIADGKDVYKLTAYDALTRNDGVYYSTMYDIKYQQTKDADKEVYSFGLAFDSATGELVGLDAIMDVDALGALLIDEQSSKILQKDEELAVKQRTYLNEQGRDALKERLSYPDGVVSLERLLDASFYLDGSKVVAIFAAPQDIGGVVKVSISL